MLGLLHEPDEPDKLNKPNKRLLLHYWLPVLAYASLIFYFSSLERPQELIPVTIWEKAAHALEYAVLAVLCYRAFLHASPPWSARNALWLAIVAAVLYGMTDELHQWFVPHRELDFADVVADGLGAWIATVLWRWST